MRFAYRSQACVRCRVRWRQDASGLCRRCAARVAEVAQAPVLVDLTRCLECGAASGNGSGCCPRCDRVLMARAFVRHKAKAPQPPSAPALYQVQADGQVFDVVWNGRKAS